MKVSARNAARPAVAALYPLAALLAAAPARAEVQFRAEAVMARYLAATGGSEARAAEQTLRFKGHITSAGLSGRWELWLAAPDRWTRRITLGPLKLREGFDGSVAWKTDLTGREAIVLSSAQATEARAEGWFLNERWALEDQGGGSIRAGSSAFGEKVSYDAIDVDPPAGHSRRMFINQKTGLIERVTSEVDGRPVEDRPSGYRRLGGRMRASVFAAPTLFEGDKPIERMTVDSVWVNPVLDPKLFSPPVVPQRAIAWQGGGGTVRTPFLYGSKCVQVKVSINGAAPADFILDTGASLSVLDKDFASHLNLKAEGSSSVQGIADSGEMQFARVGSIALTGPDGASAALQDFRVALLDLSEGAEVVLWRRPAGILGADFLGRFVVDLDYDSLMVALYDPASFQYRGGGAGIPFELHQGLPVVDMTLDGKCSGKFLVDVGNSFHFVVHGSSVRACQLFGTKQRPEVEVVGGGVGGGFISTLCRLDSLRIGPYACMQPVAALALHTQGGVGSKDLAGNIGNSVLERFRCTFDYGRKILYLEPGRRFAEHERVSRVGAMFARVGEEVMAGNILHGSAAYEAGLRWYDKIVAIDGRSLDHWTREDLDRELEEGEVGAVHHITFRRLDEPEKTVEVKLKDVL